MDTKRFRDILINLNAADDDPREHHRLLSDIPFDELDQYQKNSITKGARFDDEDDNIFTYSANRKTSLSMRYDVLNRDGHRCQSCGQTIADGVRLEVDHIVPVSRGGKSTLNNLQTLCFDCNHGKSNRYSS